MDLYVGMVLPETGSRYVIRARAMPSLMDLKDLSDGGFKSEDCDWGLQATDKALRSLSKLLLYDVAGEPVSADLVYQYALNVISYMRSEHVWVIPRSDIEAWLHKQVSVQ